MAVVDWCFCFQIFFGISDGGVSPRLIKPYWTLPTMCHVAIEAGKLEKILMAQNEDHFIHNDDIGKHALKNIKTTNTIFVILQYLTFLLPKMQSKSLERLEKTVFF